MPAAKPAKPTSSRSTSSTKKGSAAPRSTTPKPNKAAKPDFAPVFIALRHILDPFGKELAVQTDKPGNFHTEIPSIIHRGKPLYFAGIRTGKNYVSFHLLPMYNSQQLHKGMSAALKKRMQGKACFNFKEVDKALFADLKTLTKRGYQAWKKMEWVA